MSVQTRPPRPGDGEGMARVWLSAGAYYASLDPALFQVPSTDGLAESFEADIAEIADKGATSESSDTLRLVAEQEGQVAGWLTARLAQPAASAAHQLVRELGWIRLMVDALVVDQAQWRHGTGTALLEANGLTDNPDYALQHVPRKTPYAYRIAARFEGTRGSGSRIENRDC